MRRYITIIMILFSSIVLRADSFEWEPIKPSDFRIMEQDKGENHAIIVFSKCWRDDRHGTKFQFYKRMLIIDKKGTDLGTIRLTYSNKYRSSFKVRGRTIHPDGSIYNLQEKDIITKKVIKSGRSKVRQTNLLFPQVIVGSIIEYEYQYKSNDIIPYDTWDFQLKYPVRLSQYTWYIQTNYPSTYYLSHVLTDTLSIVKDPPNSNVAKKIVFSIPDLPAFKREPYSPPNIEQTSVGYFYYIYKYENDDAFWNEWAKSTNKHIAEFSKRHKKMQDIIDSISKENTKRAQLEKAYYYLQHNITNTYYLTDSQKKEKKFSNRKKIDTFDKMMKYGYASYYNINCAFIAIARRLGVKANLVGIVNWKGGYFHKEIHLISQFDNYIVCVQYDDNNDVYYDPGTWYLPPARLSYRNQGVKGLIARRNYSETITVPLDKYSNNINKHYVTVLMADDLSAHIIYKAELQGQSAYKFSNDIYDEKEDKIRKIVNDWVDGYFKQKVNITTYKVTMPKEYVDPLIIQSDFTVQNIAISAGSRIIIEPAILRLDSNNTFTDKKRKHPVIFNYPINVTDIVTIIPPEGYQLEVIPKDVAWKNSVGEYKASYKNEGRKVIYQREWIRMKSIVPTYQYRYVKAFYEKVNILDHVSISFKEE